MYKVKILGNTESKGINQLENVAKNAKFLYISNSNRTELSVLKTQKNLHPHYFSFI